MNTKIYILAIFLIGIFSSCEEAFTTTKIIDIPEHEQKLAVFSTIWDNNAQFFIKHSKKIDDNTPYQDIVADISVLENGNEILNFEYSDIDNAPNQKIYSLSETIKEGNEYTLIVKSDKFGIAKAIQKAPNKAKIEKSKIIKGGALSKYDNKPIDLIEFDIIDNADEENFYLIKLFGLDTIRNYPNPITEYRHLSIEPTKTTYAKQVNFDMLRGVVISDNNFNGAKRKLSFSFNDVYSSSGKNYSRYKLIIETITKDTYNFLISQQQYKENEYNPFAEPVVINNNIENGYGLFVVYTSKEWIIDVE